MKISKNKGGKDFLVVLKLDMYKTYNKVNLRFLIGCCERWVFGTIVDSGLCNV